VDLESVKNELVILQARKKRHEPATAAVIAERLILLDRQTRLKNRK
jgi:hypothetical protein